MSCASPENDHPSLTREGRDALDDLYTDPLFAERPPGAGRLLGEDFQTECGEEGSQLVGGRTWVLLDGGHGAIAHYQALGRGRGWEVVEEREPHRNAAFGSRSASLVMERTNGVRTYRVSVLIGRSNLHDEVEIGVHGTVTYPPLC